MKTEATVEPWSGLGDTKPVEESGEEAVRDLRLQFEEWADGTIECRRLARKCRDYRDGKQWSDSELATLKKRKQPPVTDNKIQDKCDALLGIEQQTRTDPKAFPRNPADEDSAAAATDALRYVADSSNFPETVKEACDYLMVEGLCAGEVIAEKRRGKPPKICMNPIRYDRCFWDVRSLRNDFKDKRYCGFFTWMDSEAGYEEWPEKRAYIDQSFSAQSVEGSSQSTDDTPRYVQTARGRKRFQAFTHYYIEKGKWMRAVWCRGGFLEDPKVSNYKDEDGEPDCCIEIQALYRDADGNPYGLVQRYLDLQDEVNKRRSKLLHLLNTKQIKAEKGAVENMNRFRQELHSPDGVMEFNKGFELEVITNLDMAQGQFQLLEQTTFAMSQTGPNASLVGNTGAVSGRAKQIDQQAGMLPIGPLFGALKSWKMRMFRHDWYRIKQYWKSEMWIRVTDNENAPKFVGLNIPMTQGDEFAEGLKNQPLPPEQKAQLIQQAAAHPGAQAPAIDEAGKQKVKNNVATMDMDLILDESPDTVTVQQEQFDIIASLAEKRPDIPTSMLIEASNLRNKKQILEQLSGNNDPLRQQMVQMQQKMQEIAAALEEAKVAKLASEIRKNDAAAEETQVDTVVKIATFTDGPDTTPGAPGAGSKTQVSVN